MISLDKLKSGEKATLLYIEDVEVKRRFIEIGLTKGTTIECVLESPFKNPKAYYIKNSLISIRNEAAKAVMVEVI